MSWLWCQVMPCIICCDVISRTLTHWGWVMHICIVKLTIIGSNNGLAPEWRQAIIWTNARILLIGPLGTNFSEILIGIQTFTFNKMHLKMSSAKWHPFCLSLNVLTEQVRHGVGMWGSFLSSFLGSSCHVKNKMIYVLLWQTVYALTWVLSWCLFDSLLCNSGDKYQTNSLLSVGTVHHPSLCIIFCVFTGWFTSL